jgi:hypothetical protein
VASLLALLAAAAFALGTVLQQRGTLQTAAPEGDPHFLAEIVREPVWLAGGMLQVLGWVFGFAFQAAVTKVFVDELGGGLASVLTMWTTYALIISALAGFALQQSGLKTGFLAPAMAASNATTLVISVVLGITVFDETLSSGGGRLLPALAGLVLAVVGVLLLATPQTGVPGLLDDDLTPKSRSRDPQLRSRAVG